MLEAEELSDETTEHVRELNHQAEQQASRCQREQQLKQLITQRQATAHNHSDQRAQLSKQIRREIKAIKTTNRRHQIG